MAKSIRSKWKRKMRAIKRVRYGQKELDRLKKTLGVEVSKSGSTSTTQVETQDVSDIVTLTTAAEIQEENQGEDEIMTQGEMQKIKKFNPKRLRNENGAYPIWVHPRKIKKIKKPKKKVHKSKRTAFKASLNAKKQLLSAD